MARLRTIRSAVERFSPAVFVFSAGLAINPAAQAAVSSSFAATPPVITQSATPLVMLTMSNDHQLYYKAYTDWDDLDGDDLVRGDKAADTTYKDNVDYYGYFNSSLCYDYDSVQERFEPTAAVTSGTHECNGSKWSGNFLNWATMTRIDALRKILYGGKRYNESAGATETTLERSYLPTDAHSFAKYYNGARINKFTPYTSAITVCNTTYAGSGDSETITAAPKIRVAKGDFRYWAANERWQCTWDNEQGDSSNGTNTTGSETSDPSSTATGSAEFIARVQVCSAVETALGADQHDCQSYTSGASTYWRPVGILQRFGEDGQIHFGLLTGSYAKNKSGGVVRKNIGSFASEVRADGTFAAVDGIVSSLDKLRISNYEHDDGRYNDSDDCEWNIASFDEGDCSNWGNPISEMYLEAVRYFAGLTANASFTGNDTSYISGLSRVASWSDPLNNTNRCASCNIIVINASDISYDDDALSMSGLPKGGSISLSAKDLTKVVGDKESITGNAYLVGENGTDNNQLCTAKTVSNLGDVKGICPNAPRLSGTYNMAGIGHWAHTNDIRQDLNNTQTVTTYAVTLAPAVPVIKIPVAGKTVTLLPACRNKSSVSYEGSSTIKESNCSIVDFKVLSQDLAAGTGSFYVNWEDSEQGGDYDQDMKGTISYSISGSTISITTKVEAESTSAKLGFGYVVTGTTADGFHVHSGVEGFTYADTSGTPDCASGCNLADAASTRSYTVGSSTAGLLKDPLWYTAKYGGFKDYDGNKFPSSTSEWDLRDAAGNAVSGGDGDPDNYFAVTNPRNLKDRLEQVFDNILAKVSSGTAAAVVSNSATGVGAVYQALYQPRTQNGSKSVVWTGFLHALFIDNKGYLREDSDGDGALDDYSVDRIVDVYYDSAGKETLVQRYTTSDQGVSVAADGIPVSLNALKPVWKAQDRLSDIADVVSQRTYSTSAATGRHILTSIGGVLKNFTSSAFTDADNLYRHLGVATTGEATNLIKFIRGEEGISGYRSRTVDYDNDGTDEILRLGDIIHSSPAVVGRPNEVYAAAYGDYTYAAFRDKYQNRRQVLYVGANDGMLHAFNGGFWNGSANAFQATPVGGDSNGDSVADTAHPLGSELWAYVPQNLLPHLRWLAEPDYPHVYYVDGAPLVFDANIFTADTTHPGGWGTVMVVGMRLGGSPIPVDSDGDGTADYTARSAYAVFDVTDPEQAPTLLAEITHADLGFTTSAPTVVKARVAAADGTWESPTQNDWYLVFGSGPTDLATATSAQNAQVFVYDLKTKTLAAPLDVGESNSFVGGFRSTDWNNDFVDDATYFGTAGGTAAAGTGTLQRLVGNSIYKLFDAGKPFVSAPLTRRGPDKERWIYAGTGRLYVQSDVATTQQQAFYGIKEPWDSSTSSYSLGTVALTDLQNVTGVQVYKDGHIVDTKSVLTSVTPAVDTYTKLESHVATKSGWYKLLPTVTGRPSTRNVTPAAQVSRVLLFSAYSPSTDACSPEGYSTLYGINYRAGVAEPYGALGHSSTTTYTDSDGELQPLAEETSDSTTGLSSGPVVHSGTDGSKVFENFSTGELQGTGVSLPPIKGGRMSWREIVL